MGSSFLVVSFLSRLSDGLVGTINSSEWGLKVVKIVEIGYAKTLLDCYWDLVNQMAQGQPKRLDHLLPGRVELCI